MELLDRAAEALRLAPDLIQRGETIVDIKDRILEPFRHDRAGSLLKLQDELSVGHARFVVEVLRKTEEQYVAQIIEDRFLDPRIAALRRCDGALDHGAIFICHRLDRREIGSVKRK